MDPTELTPEQHRARLHSLHWAHQAVADCRRHLVVEDYMPGQVVYNLSEYPAPDSSIRPTEYDAELLRRFADAGVELIQVHEDWNDSQRLLGGDKFSSYDAEGMRQFVDLVHSLGMQIIAYISSGYFEDSDPDFRQDWAGDYRLRELYFSYARCKPWHPGWRAYLLPRAERMLDEYGFDGLYNDTGYPPVDDGEPVCDAGELSPGPGKHAAFEDLSGMLRELCHQRGGVYKVHMRTGDIEPGKRYWDYLWVGESVRDLDGLRETARDLQPWVVPCPDLSRAQVESEDELYLHFLPYAQFPLRIDGRPMTGERALVEGIEYHDDFWTHHARAMWQHLQSNPHGPYSYGWWDSVPGRPEGREVWLDHLALYRPMVSAGSQAWLEVREGALLGEPLPDDVIASLFVNEQAYLVLANVGDAPARASLADQWADRRTGERGRQPIVPPRTLRFLTRVQTRTVGQSYISGDNTGTSEVP